MTLREREPRARRDRPERSFPRAPGNLLLLSALASIGLAVVYWRGGQPQLEGALLAVALGSLALALVAWAAAALPHGPFTEEREDLGAAEEEEALEEAAERGTEQLARRNFLRKLLAALGALGVAALFPIRSLGPRAGRALVETPWTAGARLVTTGGQPVHRDDLNVGGLAVVWPEGHVGAADAQVNLIRMAPGHLRQIRGREDWTPLGFVAYSRVCTHAGCPVGLYQPQSQTLFCPCHQSLFDATDHARPIAGPATRPLPQLPLMIDAEGFLRARGDFPEPVGPGFWRSG